MVALEVRNIDPSTKLRDIVQAHACSVLISGTLSPIESYRRYYFGDLPVTTISLPNSFPPENRRIFCTNDITTAYSMRRDAQNLARTDDYITTFAALPGNLAIYFPSYDLVNIFAERCAPRIKKKQIYIEPKESATAATMLREFMSLPGEGDPASSLQSVAASGVRAWTTGEMLAGALVIGLPLAPFNRVRRMVIDYFRMKFGPEGSSSATPSRRSTAPCRRWEGYSEHQRIGGCSSSGNDGSWSPGSAPACHRGCRRR